MLWYFRYDSYFQLFLSNHLKHLHLKISCWTACLQVRKFWNFMLHGPTGRLSFRASAEQCFPSVRKVQLKWVFPDVSNQKMKKCRIKLFLKVYIYTLYGDVYFVYFIHTLVSVVLELILSLFWITHRQGALYSCLSLGPTESRLPGIPLSRVGVIWPHQMCSCACWPVSAQGGQLCICAHGVSSFMAVKKVLPLWSVATIGWECGTAQAADGHLVWSRRKQKSLVSSVQSLSHVQLCDPMDCSTPGFPVLQQLPELTQTLVHLVSDAIQPSHPLLSPSSPAFNLS